MDSIRSWLGEIAEVRGSLQTCIKERPDPESGAPRSVTSDDYAAGLQSAAKVKCPALLILGKRDVMTPVRAARELEAALKAKTVLIDFSGHSLMAEAPDATLDALIGFFAS